tara:strand:+ start:210 stop:410 length:201 start_codon:yes stop_codon:yes gene_type:complete
MNKLIDSLTREELRQIAEASEYHITEDMQKLLGILAFNGDGDATQWELERFDILLDEMECVEEWTN